MIDAWAPPETPEKHPACVGDQDCKDSNDRLSDPSVRPPHYPGWVSTTYAILNWWESYHLMTFQ